ncbi:MAG TPA: YCF48-related protein [Candidatus Binatia bacterium]|jgi:photosystem II stability/assembly factor-like uncharacterized protein
MRTALRAILASVLLVFIEFGSGHAAQTAPGKNPCEVRLPSAPYLDAESSIRRWSQDYFLDVHFVDPLHGWVAGGDGSIYSTGDGGQSWRSEKLIDPPSGFLALQIGFRTPQEGWIAAEGQFFTTQDGGRTWRRTPAPATCTDRIKYITPTTGWLLSKPNRIFKTVDGGRTWRRQVANLNGIPMDVACFSERECIVVGSKGTILTTSDGNHWAARKTPVAGVEISRVQTTRNGVAWALAGEFREGHLLRSDDKGKSWRTVGEELAHEQDDLMFWDEKKGVIVGPDLFWTNDGGLTLNRAKLTINLRSMHAMHFVDRKVGWAAGGFKTILHTKDGGKTWVEQYNEYPPAR